MAYLEITFHEGRFEIVSQVFCCDIHDTWENRKVWFVILRSLCAPNTGKPLFSYQRIADEFGYTARQNINNYVREYEQCDENLLDYLRHKRKVDPRVVAVVREELSKDVLARTGELRIRVNQRLGREDLTSANIRIALDQIPCTVIRRSVLRELSVGSFHVKEAVVLGALFAFFEQAEVSRQNVHVRSYPPGALPSQTLEMVAVPGDDAETRVGEFCNAESARSVASHEADAHCEKLVRYAEMVSAAGIEAIHEEPDEVWIQKTQADSVVTLLTPGLALSELSESVVRMVKAMTLYHSGASLSQIGRWFGGYAKSTIYTWIMGLSFALWPVVQGWLWLHVKGKRLEIDEKWLKIRKKWHYWFVSLDQESGLPLFHDLLPTRSKWGCRLFLLKLRRLGKFPSLIITDGLKGYVSAVAKVFPGARHLLCLFHHQQSVTRCVHTQFCETAEEDANDAKKQMQQVVQTHDTRTVKRRLKRLEETAKEKGWKILTWIKQTRSKLTHIVPAVRANRYPRTTNGIERFFRAFVRFYKTRCGFHSVTSAKRAIIFFMVVYLFTIQAESGKAPIEKIIPETDTMPLYRLLNYPFADEMRSHFPPHVKPVEEMATESVEGAA